MAQESSKPVNYDEQQTFFSFEYLYNSSIIRVAVTSEYASEVLNFTFFYSFGTESK